MRFKHVKYFMREKLYFKQHYFCINKDEGKKKLFEAEKEATIQHKIQLGCNDKSFIRRLCLVINRGHDGEKNLLTSRHKLASVVLPIFFPSFVCFAFV